MSCTLTEKRESVLRNGEADLRHWNRYVESLLSAFRTRNGLASPLGSKLEELRNKRDSVVTKFEVLKRHRETGWSEARRELDKATRELRESWRSTLGTLDRESRFR